MSTAEFFGIIMLLMAIFLAVSFGIQNMITVLKAIKKVLEDKN